MKPRMINLAGTALAAIAFVGIVRLAISQGDDMASCQSNLKQMSLGLLMYQQDYDERYPPMKMPAQVQNRIHPYIKNRSVFTCPTSGKAYLPNPALNYVSLSSINAPASTMMLRDPVPHLLENSVKGWNVAYADGHVKLSIKEIPLGKPAPDPIMPKPKKKGKHK